jgi:hypothetical protein
MTEGLRQRGKGSKVEPKAETEPAPAQAADKEEHKPQHTGSGKQATAQNDQERQRRIQRGPYVRSVTWVKGGLALGILLYIHFAVEEIPFFSLTGVLSEFVSAHFHTQALVSNLLPRGCALFILGPLGVGLLLSLLFTLVIMEENNGKFSTSMLVMVPVFLGGTWLLMMGATWMVALMPMNSWTSVWAMPAMTPQEVSKSFAFSHFPRHPPALRDLRLTIAVAGGRSRCCERWCWLRRRECHGPRRAMTHTRPWTSSWCRPRPSLQQNREWD